MVVNLRRCYHFPFNSFLCGVSGLNRDSIRKKMAKVKVLESVTLVPKSVLIHCLLEVPTSVSSLIPGLTIFQASTK